MALVRTSLQKVMLFLHQLQIMAVTSPRYQRLCKVSAIEFTPAQPQTKVVGGQEANKGKFAVRSSMWL